MDDYYTEILTKMLDGYTFPEALQSLPEDRPVWQDDESIRQGFFAKYELTDLGK